MYSREFLFEFFCLIDVNGFQLFTYDVILISVSSMMS